MDKLRNLEPQFRQIDSTIAQIFGFSDDLVDRARKLVTLLMERRLARTGEATPEILKGDEKPLEMVTPSKKVRVRRKKPEETAVKLDRWSNS